MAIVTGEPASAQTVSKLARELEHLVRAFHQARRRDEGGYLFLDGVSLRVRRPNVRKREYDAVKAEVQALGYSERTGGRSMREW